MLVILLPKPARRQRLQSFTGIQCRQRAVNIICAPTGTAAPTQAQNSHKATKADMRGKLELMLGQLGIEYSELGEQRSSARLFNMFQLDPKNRHLLAFLKALDEYNQQGTIITDEASLAARITPILT
jgi:hypothetical protein